MAQRRRNGVGIHTNQSFCAKDFSLCAGNIYLPIILAWSAFANVKQMVAITDDVPDNPDIFVFEWNRVCLCERHECFLDYTPCSYVSSMLRTPLTLCMYMRIWYNRPIWNVRMSAERKEEVFVVL